MPSWTSSFCHSCTGNRQGVEPGSCSRASTSSWTISNTSASRIARTRMDESIHDKMRSGVSQQSIGLQSRPGLSVFAALGQRFASRVC